ncbi:MAG: DUF885 domain-containing protein [Bryobacteraceae bacterium]
MRRALIVVPLLVLASTGCVRKPATPFSRVVEEFVYESLAFSPVGGTQVGYHVHKGAKLDELLDDLSETSLNRQRVFYKNFEERIEGIKPESLSAEDNADKDIIAAQIAYQLFELDEAQTYRHNPAYYVELLGNALYNPFVLDYAPKAERYRHIISRLRKIPGFLEVAKKNLADSPDIWNATAVEENEGNIGLVDGLLRAGAPPELKDAYDRAAARAIESLRGFNEYLKNDLSKRKSDWRLGKERYAHKFNAVLGTKLTPEQLLQAAEEDVKEIRRQMFQLSLPLHHKWYPTHRDPVDLNLIVGETLAKIGDKHATPQTYFADARRDLDETREFVRAKNLLPLPSQDNLKVIETPEFMRGAYAVGGFVPAPALEPKLGAFYWITPIPANWPRERVESKLREYNFYSLKLLTIHEAMPGHYVQFEFANAVKPEPRRVLRAVFGNGPYIEGWAVYATGLMLDEVYLGGSPELRLTFQKQLLRMLANTILDIRLQTLGMSDDEAMDLMVNRTFQEKEEATAKLRRAKLTSCQLPTYYTGWRDWLRIREQYKKTKGAGFRLAEFHERALKPGAVPMPALERILTNVY